MEFAGDSSGSEKAKILIVDDEEAVRRLLESVLSSVPEYEVTVTNDGLTAQELLQANTFDVVVTDLSMPGLSGLELMQWARRACPGATWIILSGRGTFRDAVKAIQLGAFDFITKPLAALSSLKVAVRNALAQRRMALERDRLTQTIANNNERLSSQVAQLKQACRLLYEQAETIDEDLRRAALIQRTMLPSSPPPLHGFAVNAVYRPSRKVGGDLYDVVQLDDQHLVVYVADAAGHGVSAAMLAVLFKHRLQLTREQSAEPTPPAEVLQAVNRCLLAECSRPGLFITAAICLVNTVTGEATIASAGHPPLALLRASGRVEKIEHTGPALGLEAEAEFDQVSVQLQPSDRLLLFTDGLCETGTAEAQLLDEQLEEALAHPDQEGQFLLQALLDTFADRRGTGPQDDDVTVLLLTAARAESILDNGAPQEALPEPEPAPLPPRPVTEILIGTEGAWSVIQVQGRGDWTFSASVHDACIDELNAGRALTLDLSGCNHLDSTFLGTVQELVDHARTTEVPFEIQRISPEITLLFEELGMDRVLASITDEARPLPEEMAPLPSSTANDRRNQARILLAHETLASLNERNRQELTALIETMRKEVDRAEV